MIGHAICPFCDRQILSGGVSFGDSFLHDECYEDIQKGMGESEVGSLELVLTLEGEVDDGGEEWWR